MLTSGSENIDFGAPCSGAAEAALEDAIRTRDCSQRVITSLLKPQHAAGATAQVVMGGGGEGEEVEVEEVEEVVEEEEGEEEEKEEEEEEDEEEEEEGKRARGACRESAAQFAWLAAVSELERATQRKMAEMVLWIGQCWH